MRLKIFIVLGLLFIIVNTLSAKRVEPNDVPAVVLEGKIYRVVHYSRNGFGFNYGGIIQIYDITTHKVKNLYIYKTYRDFFIEGDSQDIFIKKLEVDLFKKQIHIFDENDREYIYDTKKQRLLGLKGFVHSYGWIALFIIISLTTILKRRNA